MSTRGVIAVEDSDKTCRAIYVHFDMYLDGGGLCLTQHYSTPDRIEKLLALGNLSALGDKLSEDDPEQDAQDVCIAYHRDYGESYKAPRVWETADKLLDQASDIYWAEYVYLFRDGEWYFDTPYRPQGWRSVKQTLQEEESMNIEWKITEQESQQEMVSADGRWHISKNQRGEQAPQFYLTNYDLLLSPHGSGTDYKQCFETFIADCDAFIEKIKTIREQARMHMDEMLAAAKELETHEN